MSHPTWVCGLKHMMLLCMMNLLSHTLRGCVDWNLSINAELTQYPTVTPYVGVWIETPELLKAVDHCQVTPYVGVWIETSDVDVEYFINSHTLRGCVDWNVIGNGSLISILCHTLRGCVDWNSQAKVCSFLSLGHTLRGCVDWNNDEVNTCIDNQSHPTWVCGLKPLLSFFLRLGKVTPYVGVWIETTWLARKDVGYGHTLRGCVDWNSRTCL